jgi:TonB-linked SusC/RagA family outer membrane protein
MKYLQLILLWICCFSVSSVWAQRKISGTITDINDEPLLGASVIIQNSDPLVGTQADELGKWELEVSETDKVLIFSFTGYTTKEITIGASNDIFVQLVEGVEMDNIIVTGMGISRDEKSIGYSVGKVDGSRVAGSGEANAIQGLAAKVSGIQVVGSGGTPGASSKILIRGNSTFTGNNQPLMVVDGVPYDNQTLGAVSEDNPFNANLGGVNNSNRALDLNPDDIETVTVLKGPAAAALYGTRASNGVLLITTKKGKTGKKAGLNVSYNTSIGFDNVNKLPDMQDTYAQGFGGGQFADSVNVDQNGVYGGAITASSWGPNMSTDTQNLQAYDNFGRYFKTGTTYNNNFSIGGGNEFAAFRLSYGNTSQTGIVPNTSLDRNTLRLNSQIGNDKFTVSASAAYSNTRSSKAQNGSNLSGVMLSLTRMPASFDILGGNGANGYDLLDGSSHTYFSPYDNPLWSSYNNPSTDNVNRFTGNVQFKYIPIKDEKQSLTLTYRLGSDSYDDQRKQIYAVGAQDPPNPTGEIWENTKRRVEINSDILATYMRQVNEDLNFTVTLGNNLNHRQDKDLFARGRNLAIPNYYNMNNASELYSSQNTTFKRLAGLFFDVSAGYKNMLYLTIAGRHDWASTFGAASRNKGFFYPSTSLSFVFTEVLPANKILSYGKLRASLARTGIEPAAYGTTTYYNKPFVTDGFTPGLSYPYLGGNGFGLSSALGNANLQPEILTGTEVGFDLRFLNGRINLDFTFYNQVSSNLLVDRPIANSSGFKTSYVNAGKMRNRGIELELNANVLKIKDFSWGLMLNFTSNRNEVLSLTDGVDRIDLESAFTGIGSFAIKGQPYGVIYGTTWERTADGKLIIGADGLPITGKQDKVGNPYPKWTAGIANTFSYKGVSLMVLFDIRKGGDLWNGTYARLSRLGRTAESVDRGQSYLIEGVTQSDTTMANTVRVDAFNYFSYYKGDRNGAAVENAIQDGGWIRLREATLTYQLPKFKGKLADLGISVFVTGRNLWLRTAYKGVDPETSLTGAGSNVGGFDYFNMPNTRSILFGLKVNY